MSTVYLIPSVLHESSIETIPAYVLSALKNCQVIFAENERTARRFFKSLDKNFDIDSYEWFAIEKTEAEQVENFKAKIKEEKNIAIISEAGCPGIADPGQVLISVAQQMNCIVKPLVGPSSILLALMASGMNGQQFEFLGYLPIESGARIKKIKEIEADSVKRNCTKIFIETPYRNNQLVESILNTCNKNTKLCIGVNITSPNEKVITATIEKWKTKKPDLHKQPAIFLIHAAS